MELVLLALIELAIPLAMAMLSLISNIMILIADIVVLIFSLLGWLSEKNTKPQSAEKQSPDSDFKIKGGRKKRWAFNLLAVASGFLLIILTVFAVANAFYFESVTRWMFGHLEKQAGIILNFEKAEGSFWAGKIKINNIKALRETHTNTTFNFEVNYAEIDISMIDLIKQNIVFDRLKIEGVSGSLVQKTKGNEKNNKKLKPRRSLKINDFSVEQVKLDYENLALLMPLKAELRLDHFKANSISSRFFIFDLLFRSSAAGSFDGINFNIDNKNLADKGFQNTWSCNDLSVGALAAFLGGPWGWFEGGRVDVSVTNQSQLGENAMLIMDWNLVFRDFQVRPPADSSLAIKAWAIPLMAYMDSKKDRLDLNFQVNLNQDDFEFSSTEDLANLVTLMVGDNLMAQLKKIGGDFRDDWQAKRDRLKSDILRPKTPQETSEEPSEGRGKIKSFLKKNK